MSKKEHIKKSHFANCEEKRSYPTRSVAERVRRRIPKNTTMCSYRCSRCGRWHIGNYRGDDIWGQLATAIVKACRNRRRESVA